MVSPRTTLRAAGAVLAVVLLAGCSGGTDPATPPPVEPATPPMTQEAETPTGTTDAPSETESTDEASETESPDETSEAPSPDADSTLAMAESDLGEVLVDGNGMTLYLFTSDTQGADASTCEGQCLVNWPPLTGDPAAGEGVDDSLLGSFTKPDGTVQATYNGWPLYYWIQDTEPGHTTGQGVQGVWFVLDRDGDAVGG